MKKILLMIFTTLVMLSFIACGKTSSIQTKEASKYADFIIGDFELFREVDNCKIIVSSIVPIDEKHINVFGTISYNNKANESLIVNYDAEFKKYLNSEDYFLSNCTYKLSKDYEPTQKAFMKYTKNLLEKGDDILEEKVDDEGFSKKNYKKLTYDITNMEISENGTSAKVYIKAKITDNYDDVYGVNIYFLEECCVDDGTIVLEDAKLERISSEK